ncbi:MAG: Rrf2 family transcriptional regulator [Clostridia bacterium]|nr:Rrf2 family transcriptional regulator [Oscillospiraceae bacterium]MBQ7004969.1 Rrf2 family transcriptional regulator [Clostridia bacterium]
MKISTKGRYGLRVMTDIAVNGNGGCVSLKDIAEREHLSEKYLEQIVNQLSKAGLVSSFRGAKGGYQLTRPAEEITVEDILKATEGSLAPVACAEDNGRCVNYGDCVTSFIWTEIYKATIGVVSSISLRDLAQRSSQIEKTELECLK